MVATNCTPIGFRAYPLDGAMLYFEPRTGTHVRVQNGATRSLVRVAPRAVMFGITNACNLRCDFCSRDRARASGWTVDTAATLLEDLARAGVLEVAFGGGEPLAFQGFEALVQRLSRTTSLALHLTTNGVLLTSTRLAGLSGMLGQVRLSIYDETPFRPAAQLLSTSGQRWGANVLVDEPRLATLPALLEELCALGAHDVALLSYVGSDATRRLTSEGDRALAAIVAASPLPCRLSVCFGHRLALPRLLVGDAAPDDCGAGSDFVSITSDRRLASCSFQDESLPIRSADDVLRHWREARTFLSAASTRDGCARTKRGSTRSLPPEGMQIWQAFSGNNSGECMLVAKFERAADAEAMLAELVPGYRPGQPYGESWQALFRDEGVDGPGVSEGYAPDALVAVGRSLLAWTSWALDDDFSELRTLAWKRGAEVLPGGIHTHDTTWVLAALRAHDPRDAALLRERAVRDGMIGLVHGVSVLLAQPLGALRPHAPGLDTMLVAHAAQLRLLAQGRPLAVELYAEPFDEPALIAAAQRLGAPLPVVPRLGLQFWPQGGDEQARRFASGIREGKVSQAGSFVLVEGLTRRKRLAVLGQRRGAHASALAGEVVLVGASLRPVQPPARRGKKAPAAPSLDPDAIAETLIARLGPGVVTAVERSASGWGGGAHVAFATAEPARVLAAIAAYAHESALLLSIGAHDGQKLERAIRRLLADLG